jgi:hypothetical protein
LGCRNFPGRLNFWHALSSLGSSCLLVFTTHTRLPGWNSPHGAPSIFFLFQFSLGLRSLFAPDFVRDCNPPRSLAFFFFPRLILGPHLPSITVQSATTLFAAALCLHNDVNNHRVSFGSDLVYIYTHKKFTHHQYTFYHQCNIATMKGVRALTVLSLAAFASAQQSLENVDACGQQCYTDALNRAGQFACAAMDFNCLCGVQNWYFDIRDCAKGCPPEYDTVVTNAVSAMCATATLPPGAPVPTSETTTEAAAPSTTEAPTQAPAESTSSSPETSTTSAASDSSTTSPAESTDSASSTNVTPVPSKAVTSSASTSAAGAAATSDSSEDAGPAGITEAAKIGIGIGVTAAVLALLAVAACIFLRKRRARQAPTQMDRFKISQPMPSDEHAYTHNNNSDYDIGGDLEMKSRRYEDMLPREEPRQMV